MSQSDYIQKLKITNSVLEEIGTDDPNNPWKNRSADSLMIEWWRSGRSGSGLRLTEVGEHAFEYAKIEKYDFIIERFSALNNTIIIFGTEWTIFLRKMNDKIKSPFYIGIIPSSIDNPKRTVYVRLYDNKLAVLVSLYGDIYSYLNREYLPD